MAYEKERQESKSLCRRLFSEAAQRNEIFRAVNQRYPVLIKTPTEEELGNGIVTQESDHSMFGSDELIIVRLTESGEPVRVQREDGTSVVDQWASLAWQIQQNFDYAGDLRQNGTRHATRKPGPAVAFIRLTAALTTWHGRGIDVAAAGSYLSNYDYGNPEPQSFATVSAVSFAAMKEPADDAQLEIFERVKALPRET